METERLPPLITNFDDIILNPYDKSVHNILRSIALDDLEWVSELIQKKKSHIHDDTIFLFAVALINVRMITHIYNSINMGISDHAIYRAYIHFVLNDKTKYIIDNCYFNVHYPEKPIFENLMNYIASKYRENYIKTNVLGPPYFDPKIGYNFESNYMINTILVMNNFTPMYRPCTWGDCDYTPRIFQYITKNIPGCIVYQKETVNFFQYIVKKYNVTLDFFSAAVRSNDYLPNFLESNGIIYNSDPTANTNLVTFSTPHVNYVMHFKNKDIIKPAQVLVDKYSPYTNISTDLDSCLYGVRKGSFNSGESLYHNIHVLLNNRSYIKKINLVSFRKDVFHFIDNHAGINTYMHLDACRIMIINLGIGHDGYLIRDAIHNDIRYNDEKKISRINFLLNLLLKMREEIIIPSYMVILALCVDGYLKIKTTDHIDEDDKFYETTESVENRKNMKRYLNIVTSLNFDLQMIMANYACGLNKKTIKSSDFSRNLKKIVARYFYN